MNFRHIKDNVRVFTTTYRLNGNVNMRSIFTVNRYNLRVFYISLFLGLSFHFLPCFFVVISERFFTLLQHQCQLHSHRCIYIARIQRPDNPLSRWPCLCNDHVLSTLQGSCFAHMLPQRSRSYTCIYLSLDRTRLGLSILPCHVQYPSPLPRRSRLDQLRTRAGSSLPHPTLTSIHTFITTRQVYERLWEIAMLLFTRANITQYPDYIFLQLN